MKNKEKLLLETKNVVKKFGGVIAVDHINFNVNLGNSLCLIGPNGAGKSTFLKLLTGEEKIDFGEIYYKNKRITKDPIFTRVRNGISMKFQTNNIFENLTIEQNLKTAALIAKRDGHYKPLDLFVSLAGFSRILKTTARNLQHSQKQWLEIAMALSVQPSLLLLDEPTTGMTQEETSKTAELLKEIGKMGLSIIVVEHDMRFVRELNWPVFVLHQGKIFFNGSVSEVQAQKEVQRIYLGKTL